MPVSSRRRSPRSGSSTRSSGVEATRLVVDTSAYARLRRGNAAVVDAISRARTVLVPTVVLGELEAGFVLGGRPAENRLMLDDFLAEPFVSVIDVTVEVAARYGHLFAQLRTAGTPVPTNDIWIAAATIATGAHLVTFDTDFARIPALSATILSD
jgi:tRNA(fMet)-specific endonuclease VapC